MRTWAGWRLALRLAWREAWRAKGRSLLVLVMVTFPVVAVVAADVAQATSSVSSGEGLDRRLGTAQARVQTLPDTRSVVQTPDPDSGGLATQGARGRQATLAAVEAALGGSRPATEVTERQVGVRTTLGVLPVDATGMNVRSPLTHGLFRLTSGRLPAAPDEVDANSALADHGFGVGDEISLTAGSSLRVVGTAESTTLRAQPALLGTLATFPAPHGGVHTWLVGGGPVSWAQVRAANLTGAVVTSRQVIEHPPPESALPSQLHGYAASGHSQIYPVLALIAAMALLEVVLLAGPAFAVGARRQSRALALIAANGGSPAQARRVVLGSAVVLGSVAAVTGTALGIGLARALLPVLQGMQDTWFGPFQIRWTHVAGIAAFGLVSAFLAAVVPAWIASRQDVVAVLAGRRGDRKASLRSPVAGVLLLALGVVGAVLGSRRGSGEFLIAGAAVVSVLGMVLLVPLVVVAVSRWGRRFPLPLRYAVRDGARHRTRTVPAVAAVAATVAGVVALSIANSSDQAQARADYRPILPTGMSEVTVNERSPDWAAEKAAIRRLAPKAAVGVVRGVASKGFWDVGLVGRHSTPAIPTDVFPSPVLVGAGSDPVLDSTLGHYLTPGQLARADQALRHGRVVVFSADPVSADRVEITVHGAGRPTPTRLPAVYVDVGAVSPPTEALVPPTLVRRLGAVPSPVGLMVSGTPLTHQQESDLDQALTAIDGASYLYVERGYQVPGAQKVVLWILFGLGAVLMLGGTLTATFLALSDARPDLATLSAVGASPRTRRGVAAAYALSIGVVGAVLGAAVGFIPGVAVTYPLTRNYTGSGPSHYLAIPWLEILGLVAALPLVVALVVGLVARSRLPLVARLD